MIIEIDPYKFLPSSPPLYVLYYKEDDEISFHSINVTYTQLKLFLEQYGYETNNIIELKKFGIDVQNIRENKKL